MGPHTALRGIRRPRALPRRRGRRRRPWISLRGLAGHCIDQPRVRPPLKRLPTRPRRTAEGEALMDEHRVPDLGEMDEQQAQHFLVEMFTHLSAEAEYEMRHEDYVMEMPQSGERIRGREKMREFQKAYPTPPTIHLRRVVVKESLWVAEGVNDYGGGQVFSVVVIFELRDSKKWGGTNPPRE